VQPPTPPPSASATMMKMSGTLAVIHDLTSENGKIRIDPFPYRPMKQVDALLRVPDKILLQVASTSSECESDRTISFVNTVPVKNVF